MEEGYTKDWPVLKKMLIDNNLEHAAQLAYGTHVQEHMFVMRARAAFRRVVTAVEENVARRAEALGELAREAELMAEEDAEIKKRAAEADKAKAAEAGVTPDEPPKE